MRGAARSPARRHAAPSCWRCSAQAAPVYGQQAILAGAFLSPFAGSIASVPAGLQVTINAHPAFLDGSVVDCVIYVADDAAVKAVLSFSFTLALGSVAGLKATSWCRGRRIDLSWSLPAGVTDYQLLRSKRGFAEYITDPGNLLGGLTPTGFSDTGLEDGTFYYYTLFISFSAGPPYIYHVNDAAKVTGLSIKDYASFEGLYVYNKFPAGMRAIDADPQLGSNRYLLRYVADAIMCGTNIVRGFIDGLSLTRDPDNMPAGQVGIPENQTGIIRAQCWDLAFPAQPEHDVATLRRVIPAFVSQVLQLKGTCPGFVNLIRLLTGWTVRCDSLIDPVCGVNRIFNAQDKDSTITLVNDTGVIGPLSITVPGQIVTDPLGIMNAPKHRTGNSPRSCKLHLRYLHARRHGDVCLCGDLGWGKPLPF